MSDSRSLMTDPARSDLGIFPVSRHLAEHDFDGLAEALKRLLNVVMNIERGDMLCSAPYERTEERQGYGNGFKDQTIYTRAGDLQLQVPQTRGIEFNPQILAPGVRSERSLTVVSCLNARRWVQVAFPP